MTHALLVYLRGSTRPLCIPQESEAAAQRSIAFVAATWLRFPPEARPASCWLVAKTATAPVLTDAGVGEAVTQNLLAAVDPREIQALQVVALKEKEGWE